MNYQIKIFFTVLLCVQSMFCRELNVFSQEKLIRFAEVDFFCRRLEAIRIMGPQIISQSSLQQNTTNAVLPTATSSTNQGQDIPKKIDKIILYKDLNLPFVQQKTANVVLFTATSSNSQDQNIPKEDDGNISQSSIKQNTADKTTPTSTALNNQNKTPQYSKYNLFMAWSINITTGMVEAVIDKIVINSTPKKYEFALPAYAGSTWYLFYAARHQLYSRFLKKEGTKNTFQISTSSLPSMLSWVVTHFILAYVQGGKSNENYNDEMIDFPER